jgi:signal transduction histidine kinase/CheY-like chemotaxis protein
LGLLSRITRAISERQDIHSIFQVVVATLEEQMPLDWACVCRHESDAGGLSIAVIGTRSSTRTPALSEGTQITLGSNGLQRCLQGELVYEPELAVLPGQFWQGLAAGSLHSLVAAPLRGGTQVFGVLLAGRAPAHGFSSDECEFLRQLSDHVALAAQQAQLHASLQAAYDDLRRTQQTVMQQERLRVLGQMASGIAHDINNAISPVSLYTEILLEREPGLNERVRAYLGTIRQGIAAVAETVARMREFYRQREAPGQQSRVCLNKLAQQVHELTRARWADIPQQRGIVIQFRTELAEDLPRILGVESELREALINLVFNAVDAMPQGGTLTLRTHTNEQRRGSGSSRQVHVDVIDTGVGMDAATRRQCLELFFTTKGERGTGLGLSMVYGTAQRHGAELDIESAPGQGTRVRLSFTAHDAPQEQTPQHSGQLPAGVRVLIVDDDPVLLKSLQDILEAEGCVVTSANGGQQGIDTFAASHTAESFNVVITDLGMPCVDGRKLAAAIKQRSPATPILMLTGWGQRLLEEGDVPEHVDRVLTKPPRLRDLRTALVELLSESAF